MTLYSSNIHIKNDSPKFIIENFFIDKFCTFLISKQKCIRIYFKLFPRKCAHNIHIVISAHAFFDLDFFLFGWLMMMMKANVYTLYICHQTDGNE